MLSGGTRFYRREWERGRHRLLGRRSFSEGGGVLAVMNAASAAPRRRKSWIPTRLESDSKRPYDGIMKTTVDIPEGDLADAMRFTRAKTKREAIVAAIQDFNRRRRMAELVKHAGTCDNMMSVEELQKQRRKG